jgi:hypothetical protein
MPRTSPRRPPDQVRGQELAKHKKKLRDKREEIDRLKRSGKAKDEIITRLQMANDYLIKTGTEQE